MRIKNKYKILGIAVISILLEMALMLFRGTSLIVSGPVSLFTFAVYTYLCLHRIKNIKPGILIIAVCSGLLIIHLPARLSCYWREALITLPDAMMHFLGIAMGYLFWRYNKIMKLLVIGLFIAITLIYPSFFKIYNHKLSFGTWSGILKKDSSDNPQLSFLTSEGESVSLENFKGKYLLLDCWSSGCAQCFRAFPKVQNLYERFKDSSNINIITAHCRFTRKKETYKTGKKILAKEGYSFPCLSIDHKDSDLVKLGVNVFPTVLVFCPKGKLIFRGNIVNATKFIDHIL